MFPQGNDRQTGQRQLLPPDCGAHALGVSHADEAEGRVRQLRLTNPRASPDIAVRGPGVVRSAVNVTPRCGVYGIGRAVRDQQLLVAPVEPAVKLDLVDGTIADELVDVSVTAAPAPLGSDGRNLFGEAGSPPGPRRRARGDSTATESRRSGSPTLSAHHDVGLKSRSEGRASGHRVASVDECFSGFGRPQRATALAWINRVTRPVPSGSES